MKAFLLVAALAVCSWSAATEPIGRPPQNPRYFQWRGRPTVLLASGEHYGAVGDAAPRLVTVPFAQLVKNARYADSPDTSPVFKPEALIAVALGIGGRKDETGDGTYYFDDFIGVWVE